MKSKLALIIFCIFIFSLVLRLNYVNSMTIDNPIRADASKYFQLAANLTFNNVYSLSQTPPLIPSTYITPGYPLFLSLCFSVTDNFDDFYNTVLNTQAILSSITVVVAFLLALRFTRLWIATTGAVLIAFSPQLIIGAGYILTETLFTFLLTLSLLIFSTALSKHKLIYFILSGVLLAISAIVRPAILLLPILLAVLSFLIDKNIKNVLVMLVSAYLIWMPWQYWKSNNAQANEPNLLASSLALGSYPNLIHKTPELKGYPYREDSEHEKMSKSVSSAMNVIVSRAKQQPLTYLKWYLLGKPLMYWNPEEVAGPGGPYVYPVIASTYTRQAISAYTLNTMMTLHPYLIALAAIECLFFFARTDKTNFTTEKNFTFLICAMLLIYFTTIHTILAPLPRYSYPLYPIAYILSASALGRLLQFTRAKLSTC